MSQRSEEFLRVPRDFVSITKIKEIMDSPDKSPLAASEDSPNKRKAEINGAQRTKRNRYISIAW